MRVIARCRPPRMSSFGSGASRAKEMTGKVLREFLVLATVMDKAKKRRRRKIPPSGGGRLISHTGSGRRVW